MNRRVFDILLIIAVLSLVVAIVWLVMAERRQSVPGAPVVNEVGP